MPFTNKPQVYNAAIHALTFGSGDNAVTIGGSNVGPFCAFDAPIANPPRVGMEIVDTGYDKTLPKLAAFYAGAETPADMAKKAAALKGCDFICLKLESTDPNGANRSVEDCIADAKAVADAIDKPLVVTGCKNIEKDAALFSGIAEALQGKNVVFLSAREEDYKSIGASVAMAYGQKVGAESAVDINLAKQLNVLMTQLGVPASSIVMNLGSAAAGYGFEYVASTLDRVKAAALDQNDAMLQMPVITPVSSETWTVKEAIVSEGDMPEWGDREQRGIEMEAVTASAVLACGSDAVILRHPETVEKISGIVAALM